MNDIKITDTNEVRTRCQTLDTGVTYYNNLVADLKNARTKISENWEGDAAAITDVLTRIDQVTNTFETALIPSMSGLSTSLVDFANEIDKVQNNTVGNGSTSTPSGSTSTPSGSTSTPSGNGSTGGGAGNIAGGALTGAGAGAAIGAAVGSIVPGAGTAIGAGVGAGVGAIVGGLGAGLDGSNTFENGFWSKHGNNFAEAWTSRSWSDQWDYSECDGLLDYVGQTADGLLGTASDLVGSVADTVGAGLNFVVDGVSELFGWIF